MSGYVECVNDVNYNGKTNKYTVFLGRKDNKRRDSTDRISLVDKYQNYRKMYKKQQKSDRNDGK